MGDNLNKAKGRRYKQSLEELFPSIAEEWHPTKNGSLNPKDVTPGANNKVWWKCEKAHEWNAYVYSRNNGSGCPFCAGKKVCEDNGIKMVFNVGGGKIQSSSWLLSKLEEYNVD